MTLTLVAPLPMAGHEVNCEIDPFDLRLDSTLREWPADRWGPRRLPTRRAYPAHWTQAGRRRHAEQNLRTLAFLQGSALLHRELDDARTRERRAERLAARMRTITDELLADLRHSDAATGRIPKQGDGKRVAS